MHGSCHSTLSSRSHVSPVCGVRKPIQHELSAAMHPVFRLRSVRLHCEEARSNLFPRLRHERREDVVPHQRHACRCHIHWLEEFGGYNSVWARATLLTKVLAQQYLSIPVYTIFKNLTIILIVSHIRNAVQRSDSLFIPRLMAK